MPKRRPKRPSPAPQKRVAPKKAPEQSFLRKVIDKHPISKLKPGELTELMNVKLEESLSRAVKASERALLANERQPLPSYTVTERTTFTASPNTPSSSSTASTQPSPSTAPTSRTLPRSFDPISECRSCRRPTPFTQLYVVPYGRFSNDLRHTDGLCGHCAQFTCTYCGNYSSTTRDYSRLFGRRCRDHEYSCTDCGNPNCVRVRYVMIYGPASAQANEAAYRCRHEQQRRHPQGYISGARADRFFIDDPHPPGRYNDQVDAAVYAMRGLSNTTARMVQNAWPDTRELPRPNATRLPSNQQIAERPPTALDAGEALSRAASITFGDVTVQATSVKILTNEQEVKEFFEDRREELLELTPSTKTSDDRPIGKERYELLELK